MDPLTRKFLLYARRLARKQCPSLRFDEIVFRSSHDRRGPFYSLPVSDVGGGPPDEGPPERVRRKFIPTQVQRRIVEAVRAWDHNTKGPLRKEELLEQLGPSTRIYKDPGGIKELLARGLVKKAHSVGYYLPEQEERIARL